MPEMREEDLKDKNDNPEDKYGRTAYCVVSEWCFTTPWCTIHYCDLSQYVCIYIYMHILITHLILQFSQFSNLMESAHLSKG